MGSSEAPTPGASRPDRDAALRQLLRPLEAHLGRPDVTELAVNGPGELWARTEGGWERHEASVTIVPRLGVLWRSNRPPICSIRNRILAVPWAPLTWAASTNCSPRMKTIIPVRIPTGMETASELMMFCNMAFSFDQIICFRMHKQYPIAGISLIRRKSYLGYYIKSTQFPGRG